MPFVLAWLLLLCVIEASGLVLQDQLPPGISWKNIKTVKVPRPYDLIFFSFFVFLSDLFSFVQVMDGVSAVHALSAYCTCVYAMRVCIHRIFECGCFVCWESVT